MQLMDLDSSSKGGVEDGLHPGPDLNASVIPNPNPPDPGCLPSQAGAMPTSCTCPGGKNERNHFLNPFVVLHSRRYRSTGSSHYPVS